MHYYSIPGIRQFRSKRLTVPYSVEQMRVICPTIRQVTEVEIVAAACEVFGIESAKLYRAGKQEDTVTVCRFIIWRLFRHYVKLTLKQCAQRFGRDHSTCLTGLRRLKGYLETDALLLAQLNNIERSLQLPLTAPTNHLKSIQ